MELDVAYSLENAQQFWAEIDDILNTSPSAPRESGCNAVDSALKSYLHFVSNFAAEYLHSEYDWARCVYKLLDSPMFRKHRGYVRRRMFGRLRKEHSSVRLHIIACTLLYDGRENQKVFETMQAEGLFMRLVELVRERRADDRGMWNVALELLYEMSRIQEIRWEDLEAIDDGFIKYLFHVVEEEPEDDDPYHYPVIRMLLVLNEQFMVCAHAPSPTVGRQQCGPTNKVIKVLCFHGMDYRTFGENIVLLINRESETCLQLLILKLLYLLFTTTATYEYFYSNDLRVLVDVIIRNLLDLPEEAQPLRHTYLRVLYPLLNHTQLCRAPHYKREEILRLLEDLSGGTRSEHFAPVDSTTCRLAGRVMTVPWLKEESKPQNPAHRLLGMTLGVMGESSVSVVEVAKQSEEPGVMIPRREDGGAGLGIAGEA